MTLLSWCGEELERHLCEVLKTYKKIEMKSFEVLLNRLAQYVNISDVCTRNYLKFAIRLAIGMHDIGKAHPNYRRINFDRLRLVCNQSNFYDCERVCKVSNKMPSFGMHEILSGSIVRSYLIRLLFISEIGEFQRKLSLDVMLSLAIAYHHEAMHLPIGPPIEDRLRSFRNWNPLEEKEAGGIVKRIVEDAIDGASFGPTISQILSEFKEAKVEFRETALAWRKSSNPVVKLYALVTGPLMICDNLVARRNRGGRAPQTFVKEALQTWPGLKSHIL